jgi:nitrate/TMAO reductase-like tetraheme cytochrome c subunit
MTADESASGPHISWMVLLGVALTTTSAGVFLVFFFLDLSGFHTNPYLGIVTFVLVPLVFVLGLALIPIGLWRRRRAAGAAGAPSWPALDFSRRPVRLIAMVVLILTGVNIAIVAAASYQTIEYADSTPFCTGLCHTPMEPEATAHRQSVHAGISCASCHVGAGPQGFVEAKLGGVRRLAGVATGRYGRPIPAPVRDLPPASETCETCHVPTRYTGEKTRQIKSYSDDEAATEQVTTLVMKVGGGGFEAGGPHGVHWHASPYTRIEYVATDPKREVIPWIAVTDLRGTREFTAEQITASEVAAGERRVMDCTDCHNRVGHAIAPSADRAVDEALATGLLSRLPFIRREAIAAVSAQYDNRQAALEAIAERLTVFYAKQANAGGNLLTHAVAATQRVYSNNVFPAMQVTWGSYPSNIGHTDAPGCFRCHDEQHKTSGGRTLTQDCETCHRMP